MSYSRTISTSIKQWGVWGLSTLYNGTLKLANTLLPHTSDELFCLTGPIITSILIETIEHTTCETATTSFTCTFSKPVAIPTFMITAASCVGFGLMAGIKYFNNNQTPISKHISLIKLKGSIESGKNFSYQVVSPYLEKAFNDPFSEGVLIHMDSPGGSPVQSSLIHNDILRLKRKTNKKVIVIAEETLASGAYMIAVSADKIYANAHTVVGSIGVIKSSFGVHELAKKMGIEHRVHTAGINKNHDDAFAPETKASQIKCQQDLNDSHIDFINTVKANRSGLSKLDEKDNVFSGDYWRGSKAKTMGLIDELGDIYDVIEKEFKTTHTVLVFKGESESTQHSVIPFLKNTLFGAINPNINIKLSLDIPSQTLKFSL